MKNLCLTLRVVISLFIILCIATQSKAQSSQYSYFMDHFWKETNETTRSYTNQLIKNTSLGKDYVVKANELYKEADNLFEEKKSLERDYDGYMGRRRSYEKQFNGAKVALALAKTSYSLCKSNCNSIRQNIKNIINNLNNLVDKMNNCNSEMNSIHDKLDGISKRLYALDGEARELIPKIKKYFSDSVKNGTISTKEKPEAL